MEKPDQKRKSPTAEEETEYQTLFARELGKINSAMEGE